MHSFVTIFFFFFQRAEGGGQGQAPPGRGLGLGQDVQERFHGLLVLRHLGNPQVRRRRLVQAADAGRGRVLQRARAAGWC